MTRLPLFLPLLFPLFFAVASRPAFADGQKAWIVEIEVEADGQPENLPVRDGVLPVTPAVYDVGVAARAARALSRFYAENGYPYNRITVSIIRDDVVSEGVGAANGGRPQVAPTGGDVGVSAGVDAGVRVPIDDFDIPIFKLRFWVDLDERVCFGPVVIGGVRRGGVFMNDARVVPGRLYNSADVDETVRRLEARPYVREVYAASPVIIEDALCGDSLWMAAVPVMVVENRGAAIEGALGYESGRGGSGGIMFGRLDLSFVNMLGYGEAAEVSYAGTSAAQRLRLSALRPWMFGLPLEAGAAAELEVEDGGYAYFGGEVSAAFEVNAKFRVGVAAKGSEVVPAVARDDGADSGGIGGSYFFYGADFFVSLLARPWERGRTVWELAARTGSGVADRERSYNRSNMELTAGVHKPIGGGAAARAASSVVTTPFAVAGRIRAMSLFTDEEYLPPAELYRVGGHGSLRGYFEEEFAFRSAAYAQAEALYYFDKAGAAYIFVDGGAGWRSPGRLSLPSATGMLGYGAGLRWGSRIGVMSVELARNINDEWSLGRVHVGIKRQM